MVAFLLTLLPAIYVVTTRGAGSFSIDGARLYADLAPAEVSLQEVCVALAEEFPERARKRIVPSSIASSGLFELDSAR